MPGILNKVETSLNGKKTFICALLIGIVATLKYLGIEIPEYILPLLGALGLGAVRSAIANKP